MLTEEERKNVRKYLICLREQRNETQQLVADSIGLTRQYYQQIEYGDRQKRMDIVLATKLADHFGVGVDYIIRQEQAENEDT